MNKWFGTTGETTSGYGFTSVFDLSKNAIVSHAAFKIDCIFDLFSIKVLFFFLPMLEFSVLQKPDGRNLSLVHTASILAGRP